MRKFLLGILCGLVLAVLGLVVLGFALVRMGGPSVPVVADNSALVLRLEGPISEAAQPEFPFPIPGQATPVTTQELWTSIRAAAKDSRIKAIVLMPAGVGAGWGKLDEIRSALIEFRKSGKPVVAWLRTPGMREYYLALAADKIYLAEEDLLYVKGLRADLTFLKGTLDKIGVQMEVEHVGKYKDAGDQLSRTSATPETREVTNSILDGIYGTFVAAVAESRKLSPEEVKALIDQGPFLAPKAVAAKLVDGTLYEDQVMEETSRLAGGGELKRQALRPYITDATSSASGTRVAWITAEGPIARGRSNDFMSDQAILSEDFIRQLRRAREDSSIKGAIVRIDSPGGDAIASDDILREMRMLRERKPTVISMSDVAASGGYFIAMTKDPVVAYPNTITGSIGVVFAKPNLKGMYDKIGLTQESISRGKNANIDNLYGPMTEAARAKLREGIQATYAGFVKRVAEGRNMTPDQVEPYAQGRAWLGSQGHERKLVDELGGIDKAIELLREKAKLAKDEPVQLIPYPPRESLFARYFGRTPEATASALAGNWLRSKGVPTEPLMLLEGGVMRIMPFSIEVR
jgi:protease-4